MSNNCNALYTNFYDSEHPSRVEGTLSYGCHEFNSIQFNIFIVSTASNLQGGAILTSTRLN